MIIIERERERYDIPESRQITGFDFIKCVVITLELHGNSENKQAMFSNGPGREL